MSHIDILKGIVGNIDAIISMNPAMARRMNELDESTAEEVDLVTGPVVSKQEVQWSEQEIDDYMWRHQQ